MDIGWPEILIILAAAVLLFGARRLPELARALGESVHELRRGLREGADDEGASDEDPT